MMPVTSIGGLSLLFISSPSLLCFLCYPRQFVLDFFPSASHFSSLFYSSLFNVGAFIKQVVYIVIKGLNLEVFLRGILKGYIRISWPDSRDNTRGKYVLIYNQLMLLTNLRINRVDCTLLELKIPKYNMMEVHE